MKTESEIKERIEYLEERIEEKEGPDMSHLIGLRNGLEWVIEE